MSGRTRIYTCDNRNCTEAALKDIFGQIRAEYIRRGLIGPGAEKKEDE